MITRRGKKKSESDKINWNRAEKEKVTVGWEESELKSWNQNLAQDEVQEWMTSAKVQIEIYLSNQALKWSVKSFDNRFSNNSSGYYIVRSSCNLWRTSESASHRFCDLDENN